MNKIKILPDNLANQIAAGEVVERPASVIKELLENALDAGAKRVQIDIELGGRRLMRVVDDGDGMERDDAILAFERHATSKIKTLEDLARIQTLGFRGEALASIASVAKVELVTKTADNEAATRVLIEGGKLIDVKDAPRSTGTTISVRDLFFNTPARRKFMRSEATENYHLTSVVTHYALANPDIAFTLTNNGREVLRLGPAKDLRERAFQVFGSNLIESLLPVSGGREFIAKIGGYVSAPRERRTTRDAQYFFINGRFVRDTALVCDARGRVLALLPLGDLRELLGGRIPEDETINVAVPQQGLIVATRFIRLRGRARHLRCLAHGLHGDAAVGRDRRRRVSLSPAHAGRRGLRRPEPARRASRPRRARLRDARRSAASRLRTLRFPDRTGRAAKAFHRAGRGDVPATRRSSAKRPRRA